MEDINKDLTIAALMESNELLGELLSRYRRSNELLRRINSELRKLKNIQYNNDLEFQAMCQSEIAEFHTSEVPAILPIHCGSILRVVDVTGGEEGFSDPLSS